MTALAVPVLVVGGYLGAGKTTLINRLLSRASAPVAVIVNDFGSVNVDAALIRSVDTDTIEFTNGCICCAPGSSLADTLFTILERRQPPSMIVVEASGAADPSVIAGYSHLRGLRPGGTVVLVDSVNARRTAADPLMSRTFARQVSVADLLVLTKTDDPSAEVEATRALVRTVNADSPLVASSPTELAELLVENPRIQVPDIAVHDRFVTETIDHDRFDDPTAIKEYLSRTPGMVRAKGIVRLVDGTDVLVQAVGATVSIVPTGLDPTGLVVISAVEAP